MGAAARRMTAHVAGSPQVALMPVRVFCHVPSGWSGKARAVANSAERMFGIS